MPKLKSPLSERQICARLRALVWKDSRVHCLHCRSYRLLYLLQEKRYHCRRCRRKTSLFSQTWLRAVKISWSSFLQLLEAWLHEFPITTTRELTGHSETTIRRYYQLFRRHIVKSIAFKPRNNVQVDEAYFGQFKKQANYYHGSRTYKVVDKICVAGIGCPETGQLAARVIRVQPKGQRIRSFIREQVPTSITIYSDGSYIYTRLQSEYRLRQQTHDRGFHNAYFIEGCWSWMKRKLFKIYHHFDRTYAEEYIAELVWRFNTRKLPKDPWDFLRNSF